MNDTQNENNVEAAFDTHLEDQDTEVSLAPVAKNSVEYIKNYDTMQQYIDEIRRYKLLTREEEHEYAVRYFKHGDLKAAASLVTANLRLVVKIAHEYRRAYQNLLDLVQEGNLGLMQAVKKYDPYKNVKLSSYAAWWIRAYILKYILNNFRMVRIGTTQTQRKLFFNLKKEQERLEAMGFEVTTKMLADNLSVKESEIREMQERLAAPEFSLDAPLDGGDGPSRTSHIDMVPDRAMRADEQVSRNQIQSKLSEVIAGFATTLKPKEKIIFEKRLLAEEPMTLQELGDEFKVSRERARQLEKRIIEKAREYFRKHLGHEFELAVRED